MSFRSISSMQTNRTMKPSTFTKALILLISVAYACQSSKSSNVEIMDVQAAKALLDEDNSIIVLDVRTLEEFNAGHLAGAINISIRDENFEERISDLDKNSKYLIHCTANIPDGRSAKSISIMSDLGFQYLISLKGGYAAWIDKGYEVTTMNE